MVRRSQYPNSRLWGSNQHQGALFGTHARKSRFFRRRMTSVFRVWRPSQHFLWVTSALMIHLCLAHSAGAHRLIVSTEGHGYTATTLQRMCCAQSLLVQDNNSSRPKPRNPFLLLLTFLPTSHPAIPPALKIPTALKTTATTNALLTAL